jgi:hypothetical protein
MTEEFCEKMVDVNQLADGEEIIITVYKKVKKTKPINIPSTILLTEDLGKKFEMAICLLYNIPYDGNYKYSMIDAEKLKQRIGSFITVFPYSIKHTAKNGYQYDFTGEDDDTIKLSAKTTKKDGMVCPQVIGQPTKKKFCEFFNIDLSIKTEEIKTYIETNVNKMLIEYYERTFDCPILYYNQKTDRLLYIKKTTEIDWLNKSIEFSHHKKNKIWGESSSISINNIKIGEFQVHNHRDCIKFRWAFEKLLDTFSENFDITIL